MSTTTKHYLVNHIATIHGATKRLLDDVKEEESMIVLGKTHNHIKWLAGHLAFTSTLAGKTLGGTLSFPEPWMDLFRRGAEVEKDLSVFPPMDEVRKKLYDLYYEVEQLAAGADDAYLNIEREIAPNWKDAPVQAVLFLCAHDFYHAGQIAMIRRHLGRDRMFG